MASVSDSPTADGRPSDGRPTTVRRPSDGRKKIGRPDGKKLDSRKNLGRPDGTISEKTVKNAGFERSRRLAIITFTTTTTTTTTLTTISGNKYSDARLTTSSLIRQPQNDVASENLRSFGRSRSRGHSRGRGRGATAGRPRHRRAGLAPTPPKKKMARWTPLDFLQF